MSEEQKGRPVEGENADNNPNRHDEEPPDGGNKNGAVGSSEDIQSPVEEPDAQREEPSAKRSWEPSFSAFVAAISAGSAVLAVFISCQATRNDQRAWVGVPGMTPFEIVEGERVKAGVMLQNAGRSPARKVTISHSVNWKNPEATPEQLLEAGRYNAAQLETHSVGVLMPSGAAPSTTYSKEPLTPEDFEGIKSRRYLLRAFGEIVYWDIFKIRRNTTYCYAYDPGRNVFYPCEAGNEMN